MKTEIEAIFYDVNPDQIRKKLIRLKAKNTRGKFKMRRVTFAVPNRDIHHWLRVRDEGDKITVAYKCQLEDGLSGTKERQINTNDFAEAVTLFSNLGFRKQRYEENYREIWDVSDVEVALDWWPHIKPCCEIEGKSETKVKEISKKLGFDLTKAFFGGAGHLYQHVYGKGDSTWILDMTEELTFDQKNPFI